MNALPLTSPTPTVGGQKRKDSNDNDNDQFHLHCDSFPRNVAERTTVTIGAADKTMKWTKECGEEVVLKTPHGTVVTQNRTVAGVDPYGYDEDGNPLHIKHGVYGIDVTFLLAFHRSKNSNDGPSKITHLSESHQPKESHSGVLANNELSQEDLVEKLMAYRME